MPLIKRTYHPYWTWEEVEANMWGDVPNKEQATKECVLFMSDTESFYSQMMKVVENWKYSCEQNLSNVSSNRIAWLGQAACAYYLNCPAEITKNAWWMLDEEKRTMANECARAAIVSWERKNA